MNIEEINNLAKLCRIKLSEDEKENLLKEMDSILGYVAQIQEVQTESLEPKAGDLRNVLRADDRSHESGEYTEIILAEAPKTERGYFKVKKIL